MISIISSTNRPGSMTELIAKYYYEVFQNQTTEEVKLLSLDLLNDIQVAPGMYNPATQCAKIKELQDEFMLPAEKFVFVVPEYNGSFPGILKYFLDAISIRKYKETYFGKEALLVGVSSGRAGNVRGLGHLSHVLMHVGTHVHPVQLPISKVLELVEDGKLTDKETQEVIKKHVKDWLSRCEQAIPL